MNKSATRARKAVVQDTAGVPQSASGRFWTQWIEPRKVVLLALRVPRSILIIKNHGPESAQLLAENGDQAVIVPGAVRATYAYGAVTVENKSEKRIMIEFDFSPILRA